MLEKAHLPGAVTDCDLDTIGDRDDSEILLMAEECSRWLTSFGAYRDSLVTAPAMAVWTALVQGEYDLVSTTYERLKDELDLRSNG